MSDGSPRGRAADRDETEARAWHHLGPGETAGRLRTDPVAGLTSAEAGRRLHEHGRNELVEGRSRTAWAIVGEQVAATMVLLLLAAAAISAALGDLTDATAILVIVVLNVALGFHQEFRAERAIAALRSLAVPHVKVRRDGGVREVAATDLVPGDVMVLEAGNVVAADARLLESVNLRTQEYFHAAVFGCQVLRHEVHQHLAGLLAAVEQQGQMRKFHERETAGRNAVHDECDIHIAAPDQIVLLRQLAQLF
jgi:hypothetical protein